MNNCDSIISIKFTILLLIFITGCSNENKKAVKSEEGVSFIYNTDKTRLAKHWGGGFEGREIQRIRPIINLRDLLRKNRYLDKGTLLSCYDYDDTQNKESKKLDYYSKELDLWAKSGGEEPLPVPPIDFKSIKKGSTVSYKVKNKIVQENGSIEWKFETKKATDGCKSAFVVQEQICVDGVFVSTYIPCNAIKENMVCKSIDNKGACIEMPCKIDDSSYTNYIYDTDENGMEDSCLPCKNPEGEEIEYQFDLTGDGVKESCHPCLDASGKSVPFMYDLDNDGENDSCLPCEYSDGSKGPYINDKNGDGVNDSCFPCTLPDGSEIGYQFDNDGDGKKESCTPPDLCDEFDPLSFTDTESSLYQYQGNWYVGKCLEEGGHKLQHFFCNPDGTMNSDIINCGFLGCSKGECKTCYDTDGANFNTYGSVYGKDGNNTFLLEDYCSFDGYFDYSIIDFICDKNDKFKSTTGSLGDCKEDEVCEKNMANGTIDCVPQYYTATCTDDDGKNDSEPDFEKKSEAWGMNKKGELFIKQDYCSSSNIIDFTCEDVMADGKIIGKKPHYNYHTCEKDEKCAEILENGITLLKCIKIEQNNNQYCYDSDKNTDNSADFENIGSVVGINKTGTAYGITDDCSYDKKSIVDYICEDNEYKTVTYSCLEGQKCEKILSSDGTNIQILACLFQCEDLDNENKVEVEGSVIDFNKGEVKSDVCNGNTLYQYECNTQNYTIKEIEEVDCTMLGYSTCCGGACCNGLCDNGKCIGE